MRMEMDHMKIIYWCNHWLFGGCLIEHMGPTPMCRGSEWNLGPNSLILFNKIQYLGQFKFPAIAWGFLQHAEPNCAEISAPNRFWASSKWAKRSPNLSRNHFNLVVQGWNLLWWGTSLNVVGHMGPTNPSLQTTRYSRRLQFSIFFENLMN